MAVVGMPTPLNLAQIVCVVCRSSRSKQRRAAFEINVTNQRRQIALRCDSRLPIPGARLFSRFSAERARRDTRDPIELPSRGLRTVAVPLPAPIRGHLLRRATIETLYPVGPVAWPY